MKALGADVRRTQKSEGMIGAQGEAKTYAKKHNALYMNQFGSEDNPNAYTHTLAQSLTEKPVSYTHLTLPTSDLV